MIPEIVLLLFQLKALPTSSGTIPESLRKLGHALRKNSFAKFSRNRLFLDRLQTLTDFLAKDSRILRENFQYGPGNRTWATTSRQERLNFLP